MSGKPAEKTGRPSGKKGADALVLALAMGDSVPAAAKKAGIGVTTAYRRLDDPEVRRQVGEVRDGLLSDAVGRLLAAAGKAVLTLERQLGSANEAAAGRAALGILANMFKGAELVELARRVEALEQTHRGRATR